jgi:hypothetical protein
VTVSGYGFFAAFLRFVANRADRADTQVRETVDILSAAADSFDQGGTFAVPAERIERAARAFAGFAAFLQKQILPETIANGHTGAEKQIRWSVDAAMEAVNQLVKAEGKPATVRLPPPP